MWKLITKVPLNNDIYEHDDSYEQRIIEYCNDHDYRYSFNGKEYCIYGKVDGEEKERMQSIDVQTLYAYAKDRGFDCTTEKMEQTPSRNPYLPITTYHQLKFTRKYTNCEFSRIETIEIDLDTKEFASKCRFYSLTIKSEDDTSEIPNIYKRLKEEENLLKKYIEDEKIKLGIYRRI